MRSFIRKKVLPESYNNKFTPRVQLFVFKDLESYIYLKLETTSETYSQNTHLRYFRFHQLRKKKKNTTSLHPVTLSKLCIFKANRSCRR